MADDSKAAGTGTAASPPVEDSKPAKARSSPTRLLVIALVAALTLAGAGYAWWSSRASKQVADEGEAPLAQQLMKQSKQRKEGKAPLFVSSLEEFLVNLPGSGGEHYLQTKVVLQVGDTATEKRVQEYLPLVRDRVLAVLSSRTLSELATVEGKAALARDVALVINAVIEPQLTAIYILQQDPTTTDLRNLERLGAVPKSSGEAAAYSASAKEAAAQFWKITTMDLPVQAVLFSSLVMQ